MEKQKMTIHRALSELKLIDSKIQKQIQEMPVYAVYQNGRQFIGSSTLAEFESTAKSKYDSVVALISRKANIKTAIVAANASTMVKVAGVQMTIADAITAKSLVGLKKILIENLRSKHNQAVASLNHNNEVVNHNLQRILEATFGKDSTKVSKDDMDNVRAPYMEANEFHIFDPLNATQKIEALEKEISDFEADVDAVLSEINAVTFIEV